MNYLYIPLLNKTTPVTPLTSYEELLMREWALQGSERIYLRSYCLTKMERMGIEPTVLKLGILSRFKHAP